MIYHVCRDYIITIDEFYRTEKDWPCIDAILKFFDGLKGKSWRVSTVHPNDSLPGTLTQSFFSTEQYNKLSNLLLPNLAKQPVEHKLPPLHLFENLKECLIKFEMGIELS